MSTQLIDLESGSTLTGDSGERLDSDAIKPVDAGEGVKAAVIDRAFENLRARTEELRQKVEELLYRADADKWIITGGNTIGEVTVPGAAAFPTVSWNETTGLCTVSEAIVVQPFVAPSTDLFGFIDWAFTESVAPFGTVTFRFEANDDPLAGTILYDYQLANSIRVYWESSASLGGGVHCVATLEGSPVHMLRIVVRADGSTTAGHVEDALNLILAPLVPDSILKFTLTGLGTTYVEWVETPGRPNEYMFNTYSREMHRMTKTVFDGFFVGSPLLTDGDGIGIWHEELTDSDTTQHGGRRQATPSTIEDLSGLAPNTVVPVTKLFKFSTEPEKIPGCIPLCRRIGTYLVFIDGTVVEHAHTATLGGEGSIDDLLARYNAHVGGTAEKHTAGVVTSTPYSWIAATNVGAAINEIVDDLAEVGVGVSGASRIGNEAINTGSAHSETIIALPLHTQIDALAGWVGERAHKTKGEKITGTWQHVGASNITAGYMSDAAVKFRWDAARSGGASGPGITIDRVERGLIDRAMTGYVYNWGNPRAWINRSDLGTTGIYKQIMLNVPRDFAFYLPESGMVSRIIVSGGITSDILYINDVSTVYSTASTVDLTSRLPAGDWRILSLCACGDGVLGVLLQNQTPAPAYTYQVHCLQMTHTSGGGYAVAPFSGFPATGVALPGTGAEGLTGLYTCALFSNIVSNGTYLFTLNGWNPSNGNNIVSRIAMSSGTRVDGRGDCPSAADQYATGGLCTNGITDIYFTTLDISDGTSHLCSAQIAAVGSGSGLASFPLTVGATIVDLCQDVCFDGVSLYAPLAGGDVATYCTASEVAGSLEKGTIAIGTLTHCCFDGRNVWFNEYVAGVLNLIGVDIGRIRSGAPPTTMDFAGARKYFMLRSGEACSSAGVLGRLLFDGDSILMVFDVDSTQALAGIFGRLTCATDRT